MTKKLIILSLVLSFALVGTMAVAKQTDTASPKLSASTAKQLDIACVKTAIGTREDAIKAAFDKFSSSISSALQIRKNDLSAAWDITDKTQRNAAIKTAWTNFTKSKKNATKIHRTEQLAAWTQFTKARKICNSGPTGENQGDDISL